jgi:hypothetical protein
MNDVTVRPIHTILLVSTFAFTLVAGASAQATSSTPESVVHAFYANPDPGVCALLTPRGLRALVPNGALRPHESLLHYCVRLITTNPTSHVVARRVSMGQTRAVVRVSYRLVKDKPPSCPYTDTVFLVRTGGRWLIDGFRYSKQHTCPPKWIAWTSVLESQVSPESRELLASSTVKDLTAGSGLVFEDAGVHELKGIPEQWHLYRVLAVAS